MNAINIRKFGRVGFDITDMGFGAAPIGNFLRPIPEEEAGGPRVRSGRDRRELRAHVRLSSRWPLCHPWQYGSGEVRRTAVPAPRTRAPAAPLCGEPIRIDAATGAPQAPARFRA